MQIVRVLGGAPEGELAVMAELSDAGMLFQSKVGAALIKGNVFPDRVGLGEACLYVAEFVDLCPMDVAVFPIFMDASLGVVQRFLDRGDGRKQFILDFN